MLRPNAWIRHQRRVEVNMTVLKSNSEQVTPRNNCQLVRKEERDTNGGFEIRQLATAVAASSSLIAIGFHSLPV